MNNTIGMSAVWYELWWKEQVSPKMDKDTKIKVGRTISDLSLERPLWYPGTYIEKSKVPELATYSKTEKFTGIQLCVVLTEIVREFDTEVPSISKIAWQKKTLRS